MISRLKIWTKIQFNITFYFVHVDHYNEISFLVVSYHTHTEYNVNNHGTYIEYLMMPLHSGGRIQR